MNTIKKIFIGATLTASMLFGAKVPGLPAYYDSRMDAYYCPDVTVRHIYSAMIDREEGKCLGFVCGYDIAVPGGGPMLTTDRVEYCPDIIVTVAQQGRMDVVAAKTFKATEDATPYFRNGALIDFVLVKQKELVDKCGGPRYRRHHYRIILCRDLNTGSDLKQRQQLLLFINLTPSLIKGNQSEVKSASDDTVFSTDTSKLL